MIINVTKYVSVYDNNITIYCVNEMYDAVYIIK